MYRDSTKAASLGLALAARPDGFLVQEIADRDGTGTDTLIGAWNAASRATCPQAMVQTGDVIVRVNHERVSAIPGALCCEGLRTQLTIWQPLLLLLTRPHHQQLSLPQRQSPTMPQDLAALHVTSVDLAASHVTDVAVPVGSVSAPVTVIGSTPAVAAAPGTAVTASTISAFTPAPASTLRWSSSTSAVPHAVTAAALSAPAVAEATPAVAHAKAEATPAVALARCECIQHHFAARAIWLPTPRSLGVDVNRDLKIYTWGTASMHAAMPGVVQYNFDATVLDARDGRADMQVMTGLNQEVQANVAGRYNFEGWLATVICRIEGSRPPLRTISINCSQGRHRSVAAAEILRRLYYRRAHVTHLTIDRRQRTE